MTDRIPFRLYVIAGRQHIASIGGVARAGVRAFQIREKGLSPAELKLLAQDANEAAPDALVLINGLTHLPAADIHKIPALKSGAKWIGASTHNTEEVQAAVLAGADFMVFGPVFATPDKGGPVGLEGLRNAVRHAGEVPVLALGGLTPENAAQAVSAGAHGVAVIRSIWEAADPAHAVGQFKRVLGNL